MSSWQFLYLLELSGSIGNLGRIHLVGSLEILVVTTQFFRLMFTERAKTAIGRAFDLLMVVYGSVLHLDARAEFVLCNVSVGAGRGAPWLDAEDFTGYFSAGRKGPQPFLRHRCVFRGGKHWLLRLMIMPPGLWLGLPGTWTRGSGM